MAGVAATWRMSAVSLSSLSNGGVRRQIHLFARRFLLRPISRRAFFRSISSSSCRSHFFGPAVILTRELSYLLPRRDFSVSAMPAAAEVAYIKSSIPEDEEEACLLAMQLATASILPMVLKAAIELDLLEMMAKAGSGAYVTPTELASMLPTSNPDAPSMLDRILGVLATYSVLKCKLKELPNGQVERTYSLTRVCKFFTKNEDGASIAPLSILFQDKVFMESWYYLKNTVLDGGLPFKHAFGADLFDYNAADPRHSTIFNQAMNDHSTIVMRKILENYNGFEGLNTLVDVGGGTGASLNAIMSKYPTIKGINFDLPNVVQDAPTYNTGVKHVGGDMFASVPKGDAIFMKWICHDWSDDQCLRLLTNCYEALPENGKVVIADSILPELPETALATKIVLHFDITMLAQTPGGKERTEKEFLTIAKLAGFKRFNKVCCVFNIWIMEFCK